jgi:hypothetical protein
LELLLVSGIKWVFSSLTIIHAQLLTQLCTGLAGESFRNQRLSAPGTVVELAQYSLAIASRISL